MWVRGGGTVFFFNEIGFLTPRRGNVGDRVGGEVMVMFVG